MTAFCHSWNCRIGHAAPMYQCFRVSTANIDCLTGKMKVGDHEIQVIKGFERLISFPGGMENAFYKNAKENDRVGGIGRMYCGKCGTRTLNAFYKKIEDQGERYGVFRATFTEIMSNFVQAWQPGSNLNCQSAIIPVAAICDGLPKHVEWDIGPKFID